MLVSDSVYAACRFFQAFTETGLKGRCAIVTSYSPAAGDIKGEETGEGLTEKLLKYDIYRKMLADLLVRDGAGAIGELPEGIRSSQGAVAETVENNVRRLIVDEMAVNPKYYEKMSAVLDALIKQRKEEAAPSVSTGQEAHSLSGVCCRPRDGPLDRGRHGGVSRGGR